MAGDAHFFQGGIGSMRGDYFSSPLYLFYLREKMVLEAGRCRSPQRDECWSGASGDLFQGLVRMSTVIPFLHAGSGG